MRTTTRIKRIKSEQPRMRRRADVRDRSSSEGEIRNRLSVGLEVHVGYAGPEELASCATPDRRDCKSGAWGNRRCEFAEAIRKTCPGLLDPQQLFIVDCDRGGVPVSA